MKRIFIFVFTVAQLMMSMQFSFADNHLRVDYLENTAPIVGNPGKGWQIYGMPSEETKEQYSSVSVCYFRYNWVALEPEEGLYDWSAIDERINTIASYGKKAAFGVVNADPYSSGYVVPKWVYDAGAQYTHSEVYPYSGGTLMQYIPVWDDPIFLEKLNSFVIALAAKYDGDPRIAYIDIRSYGSYGEGHLQRLGSDVQRLGFDGLKKHYDIYSNNFRKTQLMLPLLIDPEGYEEHLEKTDYLIERGIGFRSDSIMQECDSGYITAKAHGYSPAVFELAIGYDTLIRQGDGGSRQWNENMYLNTFKAGKPSYFDISRIEFPQEQKELFENLTNKMGYHFILTSLETVKTASPEEGFEMTMNWKNTGVTYLYEECYPAIAVMDSGNNILQRVWLDSINPKEWTPNEVASEKVRLQLSAVPNGAYSLAVGLFHNKNDDEPTYKIGNYGLTSIGWYNILRIKSANNSFELAKYNDTLTINNEKHEMRIVHENGKQYLPLRFVFEKLGASVTWSPVRGVSVETGSQLLEFSDHSLVTNSRSVTINDLLLSREGQIYFSSEALGMLNGIEAAYVGDNINIYDGKYEYSNRIKKVNAVIDSGFEDNRNSWSYNDAFFEITDENSYEGDKSLKVMNKSEEQTVHQSIEIETGKNYELTFFVNSDVPISYGVYDINNKEIGGGVTKPAIGEWVEVHLDFDIYNAINKHLYNNEGNSKIRIEFSPLSKGNGAGYIDNVTVQQVDAIQNVYGGCLFGSSDVDFETSDRNWMGRGGASIERSKDNPHSGSYCGRIYKRGGTWQGAQIDITDELLSNGPGRYKFEGWFRTAPGEGNMGITLYLAKYNSRYDCVAGVATISEDWTYVSLEKEFTEKQFENLMSAASLIMGANDAEGRKDIYFDDIKLTKISDLL